MKLFDPRRHDQTSDGVSEFNDIAVRVFSPRNGTYRIRSIWCAEFLNETM